MYSIATRHAYISSHSLIDCGSLITWSSPRRLPHIVDSSFFCIECINFKQISRMSYQAKPLCDDRLERAPRLCSIPLPPIYSSPFFIRACLADPFSSLGPIDFSRRSLAEALSTLNSDEGSRPATRPATCVIRVVNPRLASPVYILPRQGSNIVTVYDLLSGLYNHLWSHVQRVDSVDKFRFQEAILASQERCRFAGIPNDLRNIDFLDGSTLFLGLVQDVPQAHFYVVPGENGIDGYQSVTWILQTQEPHLPIYRPASR